MVLVRESVGEKRGRKREREKCEKEKCEREGHREEQASQERRDLRHYVHQTLTATTPVR